jgi:hypothetical protein
LEIGVCKGRAGFLPDLVVESSGFLPEGDSCCGFAEGGLEEGEAAQGVGQVERVCFGVAAVNAKGFFVVGQCRRELIALTKDVGYVADGVGEVEWVVQAALDSGCFLVEFESGGSVAEVAFDASEAFEGLGQESWFAGLPGLGYGFCVGGFGVVVTVLAARLVSLIQERFRGRHDGDRLSPMLSLAQMQRSIRYRKLNAPLDNPEEV